MGITLDKVQEIFNSGLVSGSGARVLDIGCSNIHTLTVEEIVAFVRRHNDVYELGSLRAWAERLAAGGVMDPVVGGINGAWLGDLLSRAGFRYTAFDIFAGYRTEFFDLNEQDLPDADRCCFDVVLNFGTTEHLIGQLNAFKVIHEATAVNGIMVHDLPMTGYLDHGYFCYNPMLFKNLAEANGYEFIALRFSGDSIDESIEKNLIRRYQSFGLLNADSDVGPWARHTVPTASIWVMFRKLKDAPFRMGLETTTTVGLVEGAIGDRYGEAIDNAETLGARRAELQGRLAELLERAPAAPLDEIMNAYALFQSAKPNTAFPLTLEKRALTLSLEHNPEHEGMKARLAVVEQLILESFPLLRRLDLAAEETPGLAFDGVELAFSGTNPSISQILAAYRAYWEQSAVERFPAALEGEALFQLGAGQSKHALVRLGQLMARLTPTMEIALR